MHFILSKNKMFFFPRGHSTTPFFILIMDQTGAEMWTIWLISRLLKTKRTPMQKTNRIACPSDATSLCFFGILSFHRFVWRRMQEKERVQFSWVRAWVCVCLLYESNKVSKWRCQNKENIRINYMWKMERTEQNQSHSTGFRTIVDNFAHLANFNEKFKCNSRLKISIMYINKSKCIWTIAEIWLKTERQTSNIRLIGTEKKEKVMCYHFY